MKKIFFQTGLAFLMVIFNAISVLAQTTVTYPQRIANYYSNWTTGTAGAFDQGSFQVGMFANGGGTKQVVSWRKFRTDASGSSSSDRAMQVGDQFVVRISATRAFGKMGFALLASPGTGSWANRESNYAISFNMDGPGYSGGYTWYARYSGGTTSTGSNNVNGQQTTYKDFTFTLTLTAPDRMNATWTDGSTTSNLYDIPLNTSNPITDYSIFLEDDWDGGANRNIFWGLGASGTQHALTNNGVLSHGQSNNSYTVSGVMTNGLDANSSSSNALNNVLVKVGTGTTTLSGVNTYVGTTTVSAGTLQFGGAGVINDNSNVILNGGTLRTGSGAGFSETVGTLTLSENSTIAFGTGAHTLQFANSSATSWTAVKTLAITGWAGSYNGTAGTAGRLFVGSNASALTTDQISKIFFFNGTNYFTSTILSSGEVVPTANIAMWWGSTGATSWTAAAGTRWDPTFISPTYNTTWTTGRASIFNVASSTITGATTNCSAIIANENVTVTASGTLGSGGTQMPVYVASGKIFNFQGQAISTAAGTGMIKNGPGILNIQGAAYPGGFILNQGLLVAGGVNAMGGAAGNSLTINGGTIGANATRDLSGKFPAGITIGGDFTLGSATAPSVATSNLTFDNNVALGSSVTRTITLGGTGIYSFNGIISGTSSNLTLEATAAGILSLGGANTYGGNTTINGGTLRLTTGADRLPTTTGVILANTSGAVLNVNGLSQTIAELSGGGTTGGNITLGAGTLTVNQTSTTTYSGVISGTNGNLVKSGSGVLILANASNAHTGTTTISAGQLRLNPVANATFDSQVILDGGTLSTSGITAGRTWTNSSTLNLNANSIIALGSNAHVLTFANSSAVTWAGSTLTITGWTGTGGGSGTAGQIFIGNTTGTLTGAQLAKISFSGFPGVPILLGTGELVPPAAGSTYTWTGATNSSWTTITNWSPNGNPGASDNVIINVPGTNTLNITTSVNCNDFTLNGTGTFNMSAAGALSIFGDVVYGGSATANMNCASIFIMASTNSQTIPPLNYGNLNASGGDRVLPNGGTIGVCGTFTRGAGAYTVTGSTVNFNGSSNQTIAFGNYDNLTISNSRGGGTLTSPAGTISVAGVFDVSTLAAYSPSVNSSSIFDFTSGSAQTIPAFFYGQLNNSGNGNRTWASSGIIDISQGFTPGSGTHTITGSTVRYSHTAVTTWNLTTFTTNVPGRHYNNLIFTGGGSTVWSLNGNTIGVNGNLTLNAGSLVVGSSGGAATLNVDGQISLAGGTFNLSNSASNAGTLNLFGNYSQSGGTFNKSGGATGTVNFAAASGTQTISQSSGAITNNGTSWNLGTGATSNTIQLLTNFVVGAGTVNARGSATIDFQNFVLSGTTTFTTFANTTLVSANANGINHSAASGSVQCSTRPFTVSGVNYVFNGSAPQVTGTALNPAAAFQTIGNLTINNSAGVTLSGTGGSGNAGNAVIVTGTVTLTSGILTLDTRDLQINQGASIAGTFSATEMIATIGSTRSNGRLVRIFTPVTGSGLTFTYPVGDVTGTAQYTPFNISNLSYATAAGSPFVAIKVKDAKQPIDAAIDNYLTRYWEISTGTSFAGATAVTFNFNSTYITGAEDVVGNDNLFKVNRFSWTTGSWTEDAASSCGSGTLTSATLNNPAQFNDHDIVGKLFAPIYFRSVASGNWENTGTWEVSTDPSFISPAPVTPGVFPVYSNSEGIQVRNTHNVTVTTLAAFGGVPVDEAVIDVGGKVTIQSLAAITVQDGTGTDLLVNGTIENQSGSASTVIGVLHYSSTGLYIHNVNSGTIPTATWDTGSECRITGVTATAPAGLGQTFSDFVWNCPSQSGSMSLSGGLTTIGRDLYITNTGGSSNYLGFTATTTLAMTVGRDMYVNGGYAAFATGVLPANSSLAITRDLLISSGAFNMARTGANPTSGISGTIGRNLDISGTGQFLISFSATGAGALTVTVAGTTTNTSSAIGLWLTGSTKNVTMTCNGLFTHSGASIQLNTVSSGVATLNANAGLTMTSGLFIIAGGTGGTGILNIADNQNLTVSGGTMTVSASTGTGTINLGTNTTSITTTALNLNGGTIEVSTGGTGILNLYGNLNLNSGSLTRTAGTSTVNLIAQGTNIGLPHAQSITQSTATVSGTIAFNIGATGTYTLAMLGSNVNLGTGSTITVTGFTPTNASYLDFATYTLTGLNFTQSNFGIMVTAHADGFWTIATGPTTGALRTTATRVLNASGNFSYTGAVAQVAGDAVTSAYNLSIFNPSAGGVTLSTNLSIVSGGTLFLNFFGLHGKLFLTNFNATIASTGSIVGASGADYIVTNGTGQLFQTVGASPVEFPVGNAAYNPITFTNSGTSRVLGVIVNNSISPALNDATKVVNRSWDVTTSGGGLNLAIVAQYNGGEEAANFNSSSPPYIGLWNGSVWSQNGATAAGSNPFTFTSTSNFTNIGTFALGKDNAFINPITTYTWTGNVDNTWANPNNWSPNTSLSGPSSVDNIIINAPGSVANLNITGAQIISDVTFNGTGILNMASGSSLTINGTVTHGGSFVANLNCNSTITYNNPASLTIPPLNYGNLANANSSVRTWAAGATTGICGTLTIGTGSSFSAGANSTVNYNGTGAQTIEALNYANLTVSNSRGGANLTSPSGTIGVSGTFDVSTLSNFTPVVNAASIFDFNGAGSQPIPAFFYGQVNNSGNGNRTWANSGVIDIAQGFSPGSGTHTITGSTIRYSSTAATTWNLTNFTTNVPGNQYHNLELVGGASTIWQPGSAFNLGLTGNLTISGTGRLIANPTTSLLTWTIAGDFSMTGGGVLTGSNSTGTTNFNITGNTSISNGTATIVGSATGAGLTTSFSTNNLNVSGASTFVLDAASNTANASITVNGNLSLTSTSTNAINWGSGTANANNVINVKGNFSKSGTGTIGQSGTYAASAGLTFNGTGTQTFSYSGAAITSAQITIASGSTLQLLTNLTMGSSANTNPLSVAGTLDCGTFVVAPGNAANTFTLNGTGTLKTANAGGVGATINGYSTTTWTTGATFEFSGATQNAGTSAYAGIGSGTNYNLTWSGTGSLTLDKSLSITTLNFSTNGLIFLGTFDITLPNAGSIVGSGFSATKMIVADGSGQLKKSFTAPSAVTFTWPIGDNTGSADYSPVTLTFTSGGNGTLGFRVVDDVHPSNAPASNFLTRYWPATSTFGAAYSWNGNFIYTGADINGTETAMKLNIWFPSASGWTEYASSSAASNMVTVTTGPSTGSLDGTDITARTDVPVYYQSVGTGPWATIGTWEIADNLSFTGAIPAIFAPNNINSAGIFIRTTHVVTVGSTVTADDLTLDAGGTLTIGAGGNFTIADGTASPDFVSNGTLNIANTTNFAAGATVNLNNAVNVTSGSFTSSATINVGGSVVYVHNVNGGSIPTATWADGSFLRITGVTNSGLTGGLSQSFYDVQWQCAQLAAINLSSTPITTVRNDFSVTNTGGFDLRLYSGNTGGTTNIGGNLIVNGGNLALSGGAGSSTSTVTVNVTGNVQISSGQLSTAGSTNTAASTLDLNVTGNWVHSGGTFNWFPGAFTIAGTHQIKLNGNFTQSGGSVAKTGTITTNFIFNKATGTQTMTQSAGTMAGGTIWQVGTGSTSNTLVLGSNVNLGASTATTFSILSGSGIQFDEFVLSGGTGAAATFNMANNTRLLTGNSAGITTSGASGSVQMTGTRTYTGASNNNQFTYNRSTGSQAAGNGLPSTMSVLNINNTSGTNNVDLPNTNYTISTLNLNAGLLNQPLGNIIIPASGTVNGNGGNFATTSLAYVTFQGTNTVTGTVGFRNCEANGGVNFGTGSQVFTNFRINGGGFVNTNGPTYQSGSTLIYNTGGNFDRGLEWNPISGRGAPHHVDVNTSTLSPARAGATYAAVAFNTTGDLTISSGGNIYMDFGGNNMTVPLNVGGNLILTGNLSGSASVGGDINVAGNWTNNGSGTNFFPNNRQVSFNGAAAQAIGGSNATNIPFPFLAISNTSGDVTTSRAITVTQRLQMNSGRLILGNFNLVLNSPAFFDLGGPSSYVVTNGTGTVTQEVNTGGGDEWFPIGPTTTLFGPVTLRQSGTTDNISISVKVAPAYTNAVNDNTQMVHMEWTMNEGTGGGNNLRTIFGWTGASEGGSFDRTSGVYHGHWNGTKYMVRAANATTGSDPYYSLSTVAQPYTGNLSTQRFVVGNINGILPCFQTSAAGDWNTATNWVDLIVPPADATVCLNHAMTLAAAPPNPSGLTFNVGGSVAINNGVTLTFQSPAFITNSSGIVQNMTTGTIAFSDLGVVNGAQAINFNNLQLNGNTTFTTVPTINNELEILSGGFVISANGPNYGSSSTLKYNTGGNYNRSNEWRATSNPGYPANVLVTGNTSLNLDAGTGVNRNIQGNLQVDNGSSISQGSSTFQLTVPGNFTLNGSYTQSTNIGGDLVLGGNWNSGASASLTSNNRDVRFNGTTAQTITTAGVINFGFLTIDNSADAVSLLSNIRAFTFRVNASRTFDLTASNKISILSNGNVLVNGTFNANNGTIEYLDGGSFTNNGTFNRGTSTIDFLPNASFTGFVLGTVQTNFHNIYLGSFSGIDFNSGPLRGRVSGVFQLRNGSFVSGNAPIYETNSKLMYSGGGIFNRNVEWDPSTLQKVEVRNNTTLKCGSNGTGFSHVMADSLIIQSGSVFDMTGPDMTAPTVVGGNVLLRGTMNLSNTAGGDLQVAGDWENDGGTFNCNQRLTTFDGNLDASIKGATQTTFCLLTVNKNPVNTMTATVPFTVSRPPGGTTLRVAGGTFDLNGQTLTLGAGSNSLRVDAGFANNQTLKTGGTNIGGFANYTDDGITTTNLGGKVDYSGTGSETLITGTTTYNRLWITGGATKTITQTTTANGDVNIDPATTLDFGAAASILNAKADIVNEGTTIGTGLGKIELNGTVVQNMSGNGTYRNLDINNVNNVNSTGIPTISSKLNVVSGKILQASLNDSIILGPTATITETFINPANQHFVRGKLHTTRVVGVNAETFGDMGVSLNAGSDLGTVEVTRLSGVALISPITSNSGILRSWRVTPTIQPTVANRNLTFTWPSQDDNGLDMNAAVLYKRTDGTQPWLPVTAPTNVTGNDPHNITYANIASFSEFTVSDLNNPLPLNLLSFNGRNDGGVAILTWATSAERDNLGFDIMKSTDGINFEKIGFVASQGTNGDYRFVDNNLRVNSYYKLIQRDESGHFTESRKVFISTKLGEQLSLDLYPNPGQTGFAIRYNGFESGPDQLNVEIFNMEGKSIRIITGTLTEINTIMKKDLAAVSNGVYMVKVLAGFDLHHLKWVKQ